MTRFNATFVFLTLSIVLAAAPAALAEPTPTPAPAPYSLPWQLRPATIGTAVRLDSAIAAFNDTKGNLDLDLTTILAVSYRWTKEWAPMLRLGFVGNNAPGAVLDGSSFVNPVVGATYARELGSYKLAFFGATTVPIGMGGGNAPNRRAATADTASATARPADDAMFAVDYLAEIVGADFAYVNHGFTAQLEVTLQPMFRVRGSDNPAATDAARLNSAVGLHLGYFMGSHFSLGADLRYQRWLSHPTTVDRVSGAHVSITSANMDSVTLAFGPRFHFKLGEHAGIHPGLSFMRGFDARGFSAPLLNAQTLAIQLDVPVTF